MHAAGSSPCTVHLPPMLMRSGRHVALLSVQVCVAGWSMGAVHACMVAALCRTPVAVAAMMPPSSATAAYCDGSLASFVDVRALQASRGRDMHGAHLLPAVAAALRRNDVFPNHSSLLRHHEPCTALRAGESPAGIQADVAADGNHNSPAGAGIQAHASVDCKHAMWLPPPPAIPRAPFTLAYTTLRVVLCLLSSAAWCRQRCAGGRSDRGVAKQGSMGSGARPRADAATSAGYA